MTAARHVATRSAPLSWPVVITLSGAPIAGTIEFPSLRCAGTLSLVPPAPTARELHVRQTTTVDTDLRCAPGANLALILSGTDEAELFWQAIDNSNNTATATLTSS